MQRSLEMQTNVSNSLFLLNGKYNKEKWWWWYLILDRIWIWVGWVKDSRVSLSALQRAFLLCMCIDRCVSMSVSTIQSYEEEVSCCSSAKKKKKKKKNLRLGTEMMWRRARDYSVPVRASCCQLEERNQNQLLLFFNSQL